MSDKAYRLVIKKEKLKCKTCPISRKLHNKFAHTNPICHLKKLSHNIITFVQWQMDSPYYCKCQPTLSTTTGSQHIRLLLF